ncbi:MAG TPA: hypothetical protein VGP95_02940, partial [Gemmatimonadaceae bacterium]|nr:hypothetical protein [Gemmatimonadaceae bacterium]
MRTARHAILAFMPRAAQRCEGTMSGRYPASTARVALLASVFVCSARTGGAQTTAGAETRFQP